MGKKTFIFEIHDLVAPSMRNVKKLQTFEFEIQEITRYPYGYISSGLYPSSFSYNSKSQDGVYQIKAAPFLAS
jgi:hypothetical protein